MMKWTQRLWYPLLLIAYCMFLLCLSFTDNDHYVLHSSAVTTPTTRFHLLAVTDCSMENGRLASLSTPVHPFFVLEGLPPTPPVDDK